MFAILEILPKDVGRFAKWREKLYPPEIFLEQIKTSAHTPYYIIRAQERVEGIPWDEIEKTAGRCKNRLLLQEEISPPSNMGISAFKPSIFPTILLFNTAVKILEQMNSSPSSLSCAIADKQAKAGELLHKLLPFCQSLTVYTENIPKYMALASKLFDEFGASIIVTDDKQAVQKALFTLSLHKDDELFSKRGFSLTFKKSNNPRAISLGRVTIPDEFYLPPIEGISRFDFLCALYELCSAHSLSGLYCESLFCEKREMAIGTISDFICATCHLDRQKLRKN